VIKTFFNLQNIAFNFVIVELGMIKKEFKERELSVVVDFKQRD